MCDLNLLLEQNQDLLFEVIPALVFFGGTMALSSGLFSRNLTQEAYFNGIKRFSALWCFAKIFGQWNFQELNPFLGGYWEDIKRNSDFNAPIRGFVWYLLGTAVYILGIFI